MLVPIRPVYAVSQPIVIDSDRAGEFVITHLGREIRRVTASEPGLIDLGPLPPGGYGIRHFSSGESTAVQVATDPRARLRYGFVSDFRPGKDVGGVLRFARRLHLTGIQFYDWAYRHADLMGGGAEYEDALSQTISLETVRALTSALAASGIASMGYAAVYAVGKEEWEDWQNIALLQADGAPHSLADFLNIIDPADPEWLAHFTQDLRKAAESVGFVGFHLDQYGYPKTAVRADGKIVDVAESFVRMIEVVRESLPAAQLVFNNVNDFPTWSSAQAPQDAVYIEPWAPIADYGDLAGVVTRARSLARGKPVVLAAYQSVYASAPCEQADAAARLTMATLFSHGATQLLAGENGRILVDPYYVKNREAEVSTLDMLVRWYDFLVENDELLMPPEIVDVTSSYVGEYNGDIDVSYTDVPVSGTSRPGTVWRRLVKTPSGLVLHLINLVDQKTTEWDQPHIPPTPLAGGVLRMKPLLGRTPAVSVADPDDSSTLVPLHVTFDGHAASVKLPPLHTWQVLHVVL